VTLVTFVAASSLAAQEVSIQKHSGFYAAFGLGAGTHNNTALDGDALLGAGGFMRVGRAVSQRLLLGFETAAWIRNEGNVRLTRGNVTLAAMVYPSLAGGLYFKGAIGLASDETGTKIGDYTMVERKTGVGSTWGLGYDIRLGGQSLPRSKFRHPATNDRAKRRDEHQRHHAVHARPHLALTGLSLLHLSTAGWIDLSPVGPGRGIIQRPGPRPGTDLGVYGRGMPRP
jgi:hypothetical protein